MEHLADTVISSAGPISKAFWKREIRTYLQAAGFVKDLPYGRNNDKDDPLCGLKAGFGTCSTKHALLKRLADENNLMDVKLRLGIFRMNAQNTPEIEETLRHYRLDYIPEAHNYLTLHGEIIDSTTGNSSKEDFINDLLLETDIEPEQITNYKVRFHKEFLANWLQDHPDICYSLEELYSVREECIQCLADSKSFAPLPVTFKCKLALMEIEENGFIFSDDKRLLDVAAIHAYLTHQSYWAEGIPLETVQRSIDNSLCFGIYKEGKQIGFARWVTDKATFGYLADVYVLEPFRGLGLSKKLLSLMLLHPDLQGLRRYMLATLDAQGLYAQFGFKPIENPERLMGINLPNIYKKKA